ncbi:MAG: hypothetical protein MRK01_17330 [Candidatus Scalindua sp.]|nr:hypothetical protein [Candidatus Scalindua sp.]
MFVNIGFVIESRHVSPDILTLANFHNDPFAIMQGFFIFYSTAGIKLSMKTVLMSRPIKVSKA